MNHSSVASSPVYRSAVVAISKGIIPKIHRTYSSVFELVLLVMQLSQRPMDIVRTSLQIPKHIPVSVIT